MAARLRTIRFHIGPFPSRTSLDGLLHIAAGAKPPTLCGIGREAGMGFTVDHDPRQGDVCLACLALALGVQEDRRERHLKVA